MMADVVIGSAYGDEGKGHVTHALASPQSLVIRFNGGCQAGHTVVLPEGRYHVFSQIGSGALKGAATLLSRHFVVNPMMFRTESEEFLSRFHNVSLYASEDCRVTTPYDIALNVMLERSRGFAKHGSVGVGFGETIERNERGYGFTLKEIVDDINNNQDAAREKIRMIARNWVPQRMSEMNLSMEDNENLRDLLTSDNTIENFLTDCEYFASNFQIVDDEWLMRQYEHLVFEGAQGLLLDTDYGDFPHVTRSRTGLANVRDLFPFDIKWNIYYVSRAYTTRHGAGPLPHERDNVYNIRDKTNQPNEYQGNLRYSYLNVDTIEQAVRYDLKNYGTDNMKVRAVMTCMDEVPEYASFILQGELWNADKDVLPLTMEAVIDAENVWITDSPSSHLREVDR